MPPKMKGKKAPLPEPEPEPELDEAEEEEDDEESEDGEEEESGSSGDNEESSGEEDASDAEGDGSEEEDEDSEEDGDEFEDQGSSSDDEETFAAQAEASDGSDEEEEGEDGVAAVEAEGPRHWSIRSKELTVAREHELAAKRADGRLAVEEALHVDDLSSDDEKPGNAIGQVPLRWYEDYDHIGYDVHGKQIAKKDKVSGLDRAIAGQDDPTLAKRTVYDALNDTEVVLSDRDLEIIRRIQSGAYAHPEHEAHPEYIPYYSEVDKHQVPLSEKDLPKRRFVPSKWELMKITTIIKGLKDGSILPREEQARRKAAAKQAKDAPHMIWSQADDDLDGLDARKGPMHIAAPKLPPPGHAASYRPPEEYLFSPEEEAAWRAAAPEDRELDFLPQSFDSLRAVGAYPQMVRERFERCLDLYLCPRSFKRKLAIDPESLVPKLPSPKDLKPFPTAPVLQFEGHKAPVRSLATSPDGQFLASGDDRGMLKLWEVATGRCLHSWVLHGDSKSQLQRKKAADSSDDDDENDDDGDVDGASTSEKGTPIAHVCWNPNRLHALLAVASGSSVFLVATGTGGSEATELTDALLSTSEMTPSGPPEGAKTAPLQAVTWGPEKASSSSSSETKGRQGSVVGPRVRIQFGGAVTSLCWHRKGDYLGTAVPSADTCNVMVHQVSKRVSQVVIRRQTKTVAALAFHPFQPIFFVATQQHVRVYHLLQQKLMKKLLTGCKMVSCMDVHPSGDHVLIGSYDRRVVWFDLDRGGMPYKTLKYHTHALRGLGFHRAYPLMATASDDGSVHVFHATVYSDLMKDPLLVPVKQLVHRQASSSSSSSKKAALALAFHSTQPWLFSAGSDNNIVLFQDL